MRSGIPGACPPAVRKDQADHHRGTAPVIRLTAGPPRSLPVACVLELRQRIRDGAYRSPGVVDEIARRLLLSFDL